MVLKFDGEPLLPQRMVPAAVLGGVATVALLTLREMAAIRVPVWLCLLGLLPALIVAAALFGLASGAVALVGLCRLLAFRDERLRHRAARSTIPQPPRLTP